MWRHSHRTCLDGDASRLVNSGLKPAVKDAVQLQVEVLVQFITSSWLYQNERSFGSAVMIPPLHYIQMSPSFEREIMGRDVDAGARLRTQVSGAELQGACRGRMLATLERDPGNNSFRDLDTEEARDSAE